MAFWMKKKKSIFFHLLCRKHISGVNISLHLKLWIWTVIKKKKTRREKTCSSYLVGVAGLEPTTAWSQTRNATNCATPRIILKEQITFSLRMFRLPIPKNRKFPTFVIFRGSSILYQIKDLSKSGLRYTPNKINFTF